MSRNHALNMADLVEWNKAMARGTSLQSTALENILSSQRGSMSRALKPTVNPYTCTDTRLQQAYDKLIFD